MILHGGALVASTAVVEADVELADEVSVLRDGQVVHSEAVHALNIPKIVAHMVGREEFGLIGNNSPAMTPPGGPMPLRRPMPAPCSSWWHLSSWRRPTSPSTARS